MGATACISTRATVRQVPGAITWVGEGPTTGDTEPALHDGAWFIREAERQAAAMNRRAYAAVLLLGALCVASYLALS